VPGFYVENFGCRATQADGAALERQFEERGLSRASSPAQASVVVLNTCTVTAGADQDARAAIRRVRRQNPDARIVVTGCYAQRAPDEIGALPGVDLVVGNSHKHELARIALPHLVTTNSLQSNFVSLERLTHNRVASTEYSPESAIFVSDIFAHTELVAAPVFDAANERTRPNLKIQDGCDNRCSFCVIPYVRGQSRSLGPERIINEIKALVRAGYREVVLSGINLGRWGRDLPTRVGTAGQAHVGRAALGRPGERNSPVSFVDLIHSILAETPLEKLRISSVEPMDWTDDLISVMASSPRIAKHAHVPMQSGSDAVLRRMHRKYRPWHYRDKIKKIRAAMPTAAIGADVMVGFPGEDDAEFDSTRKMVEELPFTYLHVFTYSARPGTPAAEMPKHVPVHIARERNRMLRELASKKKLAFMRLFISKSLEAITLNAIGNDSEGAYTECLTDNYLKLRLRGSHQANRWQNVKVQGIGHASLLGFPGLGQ
jgi:threonylcarbamoyladenosine tRNA methylthiotransferase MtaB